MKKVGILTLGCRVNQYESDAIAELIEMKGFEIAPFDSDCDLYIINTCTVTAESDSKSRKAIRRAFRQREKSGAKVAVIGCFSQGAKENCEELEKADFVSGNRNKKDIVKYLDKVLEGQKFDLRQSLAGAEYENLSINSCKYVKAYVKIEDGCNNFCSYCYVPFVRGRVRSRCESDILSEVSRLKEKGYREIILTGIETSSYGEDLNLDEPLITLVEKIQKETPIERLRFGSLHPSFFTKERVERLASCGVMPHFHLSVQSASSRVLSLMKRGYDSDCLYNSVELIRKAFPDANLSCDMICGFPEEDESDFEESLEFIKNARILHTHIFPYSRREGTVASKMKEVHNAELYRRSRVIQNLADEVHKSVFEENIGKEYNVLLEFFKSGKAQGYTENFINLSFDIRDAKKGDIVKVKITPDMDKSLQIDNEKQKKV